MNNKKAILLSISLGLSSQINADNILDFNNPEYTIKLGGWSSHHENKTLNKQYFESTGEKLIMNETHNGLGFKYGIPLKNRNDRVILETWYMKDSFNQNSIHLSAGYEYRYKMKIIDSIDFGINITYANRTFQKVINTINAKYKKNSKEIYYELENEFKLERKNIVFPVPYISFNLTENINIDTTILFLPSEYTVLSDDKSEYHYKKTYENVIFTRIGFKFN